MLACANGWPIRTLVISVVPVFSEDAVMVSVGVRLSPVKYLISMMPAVASMINLLSTRIQVSSGRADEAVATTVDPLTACNWRLVLSAIRVRVAASRVCQ
jgi:hypothetical protein